MTRDIEQEARYTAPALEAFVGVMQDEAMRVNELHSENEGFRHAFVVE